MDAANNLHLNVAKTQFCVFGTRQKLSQIQNIQSVELKGEIITRQDSVKNLGVIFAANMTFKEHILTLRK